MTVAFSLGGRPRLSDRQAELVARRLERLQTGVGGALASRLRHRIDGGGDEPLPVTTEELESLLAVLAEARLAREHEAFADLQAEAVAEFVSRPS